MRYFYPLVLSLIICNHVWADHANIEEVIIKGASQNSSVFSLNEQFNLGSTDAAQLLKNLPGANVNSNGPITGIVQYRGLYGNRVTVYIDQSPALTGGPNAMDTPLSYTPPLLLKQLQLYPGIVSVAKAQQSIGGFVSAELNRGEFTDSNPFETSGALSSRFNHNTHGNSSALRAVAANNQHKVSLLASMDEGDDTLAGNNKTVGGSQYRRNRYDLGYGWQQDETSIQIYTGQLDTHDTGTAALPMDIVFINSDLAGVNGKTTLGKAVISGSFSYSHVDHGMDNFSHRLAPASPARYRFNHATALGKSWKLHSQRALKKGLLTLGADGNHRLHNSEISNPNNPLFALHNFNDIKQNTLGIFTQWNATLANWHIESGLRYNHTELNAGKISTAGLMGMMAQNAQLLATQFNNAQRNLSHNNIDIVLKADTSLTKSVSLQLGLARKNRVPSYQEHFLWLPLSATGGLADGRNYIGNLNLDSETSREFTAGISLTGENSWLTPELFYRNIDNYIQGVPSTNVAANMLSTMMIEKPALMFDNIEAELYGADMAWGYQLSTHIAVQGTLSYVRGKRTDQNDNLYRVAPLSHLLALTYQNDNWQFSAESLISAKQTKTSSFNDELPSAGFGIINLSAQYQLLLNNGISKIEFSAGVDNLFDKFYQNHLGGYNRNGDSDIAAGEHLAGTGRNLFVAAAIHW